MKFGIFTAALFALSVPAKAADVAFYRKAKVETPDIAELYLAGAGDGLMAANTLAVGKKEPIFCPPTKLVLNVDNYKVITDSQLEHMEDRFEKSNREAELEAFPLSLVLMYGLQRTFPCPVSKKR